jgi:glutamate synthase (NADPH/NADH) small chain
MGEPKGFKEHPRKPLPRRPVQERIGDYQEFLLDWTEEDARKQGGRCMDCGIPFCHRGCPLGNLIPEWNDFVYRGQWQRALAALHATNNFPDFTGRICPAPCEASCTLAINQDPVTIEYIEKTISDRGWREGWIRPQPPAIRTGKRAAVVGSGPAGLAAAQQLNRAGHSVTVFERDAYIGGLLRLGIPDFKLEKLVVQRRVDQMAEEGVVFRTNTFVGRNYSVDELKSSFDAIVLAGGSTVPRDLPVPGRELDGVHFAMDYLTQQNKINAGEGVGLAERISAEGKRVVILGGGDTGADCLGTAHRQGAEIVRQFELLSEPPTARAFNNPWPQWPVILRSSAAHEEGGVRDYDISTTHFSGSNGHVEKLHAVRVGWERDESGRMSMSPIAGTEFAVDADLVLLAMGFLHPEHAGMLQELGVELDPRGNVKLDAGRQTNVPGVFAAGDMARGQSLVVWALAEGRETAFYVDKYLMGESELPRPYLMPAP